MHYAFQAEQMEQGYTIQSTQWAQNTSLKKITGSSWRSKTVMKAGLGCNSGL